MNKDRIHPTQIGLAGEYYVLAQLTQRGLIVTLTLSTTKGVDILVLNPGREKLFKVEVKTTHRSPEWIVDSGQWIVLRRALFAQDKWIVNCPSTSSGSPMGMESVEDNG